MGAVRHVEITAKVSAFARPLDRNVEAGRAPARVGAHENLAFAEHEVLVTGGDASEAVELHICRRPLDGAVACPMKVDCAHCAHRARCFRAPSVGLEVASPSQVALLGSFDPRHGVSNAQMVEIYRERRQLAPLDPLLQHAPLAVPLALEYLKNGSVGAN